MLANVTFSVESGLLKKARIKAMQEHQVLNRVFRLWLAEYVYPAPRRSGHKEIMKRLSYAVPGRQFSRDELNER